jgi:hypothetical protein
MMWLALSICAATSSGNTFVELESSAEHLGFALGVNHEWAWDGTHGPPTPGISKSLDLRVGKAYGSKGYDKLRISVVTRTAANDTASGLFTYSCPFRYRWTQLFLRSGLLTVTPGQETTLKIDGMTVRLRLPQEDAGVIGIVFADPCIGSPWLNCSLGVETFLTPTRLPALLNAAAPQLDYWGTWGDNFYDKNGSLSTQFFAQLSQEVKSRVFFSAAGNHDFWVSGSPNHSQPDDQFGNGYMQYYAMDSAASQDDPSQPFNFSVSPDGAQPETRGFLPDARNFVHYSKVGNQGYLVFSGVYGFTEMKPHFAEFCTWLGTAGVAVAFIAGHFNVANAGCQPGMATSMVYDAIRTYPGCKELDAKGLLMFQEGHEHCNMVVDPGVGFMVGGQGVGLYGCNYSLWGYDNFGIPVVDSTGGRVRVLYFPVADTLGVDNFDAIHECFRDKGLSACAHLAEIWIDKPL